ncbi:MAG: hypothetical protein JO184_08815 [Gammaproteobacteria bacterium]|nr:hypothetical protein [Gammaproteobacteria bacterium]MBV8402719.1 hypothetical protein [Gammaproteobacteria bacterium]
MSTLESTPHTPEPVTAAEEAEPVVVLEAESEVRVATPVALPVPASVYQPARTAAVPVAANTAASPLAPLQRAAGELLPQLQYQITRLGVAGQAGLAACVAAVAIAITVLLPAQQALHGLHGDLVRALHPAASTSIEQAVPNLVASLPTRAQIPAVIGQIYAQAQSAGVAIDKGRYQYEPPKTGSIGRYDVEFPVVAGYPAVRTFINGTLTAVPAASLSKLRLERKAVGEQVVNADVEFVIFVRGEAQP